jgi:hypothetical protein
VQILDHSRRVAEHPTHGIDIRIRYRLKNNLAAGFVDGNPGSGFHPEFAAEPGRDDELSLRGKFRKFNAHSYILANVGYR